MAGLSGAPTFGEMCRVMEERLEGLRYAFDSQPTVGIVVTTLYVWVLTVGAMGNALVMVSVWRNAAMRTPRNCFIVNLALSDFLLCTLTVPFNMKMILFLYWDLGELACNVVSTAQGVNIFVSTMSIAAIALDRYLVIIFPTKTLHQRTFITVLIILVWGLSLLFSSPYFFATSVSTVFSTNEKLLFALKECALAGRYEICQEDQELWKALPVGPENFTIFCFVFQYFLPLFATIFVYARIGWRMRLRLQQGPSSRCGNEDRRRSIANRHRRTNLLLISLVLIFAIAWLPLNIYNTLIIFQVVNYNLTTFAFCHITGMMSACTNPILYGVFNDNFRTEFEQIFEQLRILALARMVKRQLCCGRGEDAGAGHVKSGCTKETRAEGMSLLHAPDIPMASTALTTPVLGSSLSPSHSQLHTPLPTPLHSPATFHSASDLLPPSATVIRNGHAPTTRPNPAAEDNDEVLL